MWKPYTPSHCVHSIHYEGVCAAKFRKSAASTLEKRHKYIFAYTHTNRHMYQLYINIV